MATDTKAAARAAFDRVEGELIALSHRIHAHPEIKWEEERAASSEPGGGRASATRLWKDSIPGPRAISTR